MSFYLDIGSYLAQSYDSVPAVCAVTSLLQYIQPEHRGAGVTIGLIEPALEVVDDLIGAQFTLASFAAVPAETPALREHGTHSATLLVGQGQRSVLGLVPGARLLMAIVAEADGRATPHGVATAIDWLEAEGADLVAIPLGDSTNYDVIDVAITRAHERGIQFFAAAGNLHPQEVMFPARHSAVCAVGAIDYRGRLRPECCRSPRIDQTAPGTELPALVRLGTVEARSGSSVACVVAVGLAALQKASGLTARGSSC